MKLAKALTSVFATGKKGKPLIVVGGIALSTLGWNFVRTDHRVEARRIAGRELEDYLLRSAGDHVPEGKTSSVAISFFFAVSSSGTELTADKVVVSYGRSSGSQPKVVTATADDCPQTLAFVANVILDAVQALSLAGVTASIIDLQMTDASGERVSVSRAATCVNDHALAHGGMCAMCNPPSTHGADGVSDVVWKKSKDPPGYEVDSISGWSLLKEGPLGLQRVESMEGSSHRVHFKAAVGVGTGCSAVLGPESWSYIREGVTELGYLVHLKQMGDGDKINSGHAHLHLYSGEGQPFGTAAGSVPISLRARTDLADLVFQLDRAAAGPVLTPSVNGEDRGICCLLPVPDEPVGLEVVSWAAVAFGLFGCSTNLASEIVAVARNSSGDGGAAESLIRKLWRLVGETVPGETEVGDAAALAAVYAEARRVGLPILRKDFEAARSPPSVVISLPGVSGSCGPFVRYEEMLEPVHGGFSATAPGRRFPLVEEGDCPEVVTLSVVEGMPTKRLTASIRGICPDTSVYRLVAAVNAAGRFLGLGPDDVVGWGETEAECVLGGALYQIAGNDQAAVDLILGYDPSDMGGEGSVVHAIDKWYGPWEEQGLRVAVDEFGEVYTNANVQMEGVVVCEWDDVPFGGRWFEALRALEAWEVSKYRFGRAVNDMVSSFAPVYTTRWGEAVSIPGRNVDAGFTVASERSMAALFLRPLAEVCDVFDRDLPAALEPLLHLRHSVVWDGPTVHVTKSVMLIACEDFMVGGALAPLAASFADELPAKHMIVTPGKRESDITGAFFVAGARGNPLRKVVDYEHGVVEHRRTYSSDAFRLMLGTEYANGMGYEVISGIPGVHPKLETDFIQWTPAKGRQTWAARAAYQQAGRSTAHLVREPNVVLLGGTVAEYRRAVFASLGPGETGMRRVAIVQPEPEAFRRAVLAKRLQDSMFAGKCVVFACPAEGMNKIRHFYGGVRELPKNYHRKFNLHTFSRGAFEAAVEEYTVVTVPSEAMTGDLADRVDFTILIKGFQYPKELQDVLSVIPSVAVSAFTPQCRIVSVVRSPDLVKGQWDVILAGSVLQNLRVGRFFAPFTLISMAWQWQVKYVAGVVPHEGDILVEGEEGALRRLVGACYQMGIPIECCGIADWMLGGAKREFTDQLAAFAFPGPRFEVPEGYFTRTLEPLGDGPFFYRFLAREGVVTAESMRCFHTTSNSRFSVNHS